MVETRWKKAPDLSKATVWKSELWRHADDEPTREGAVKRLVKMLKELIAAAEDEGLKLAPFIGIACPGVIDADGSIEKGAQNLPGNWESRPLWTIKIKSDRVFDDPYPSAEAQQGLLVHPYVYDAQLKGDSLRRQLENSSRYVADNNFPGSRAFPRSRCQRTELWAALSRLSDPDILPKALT